MSFPIASEMKKNLTVMVQVQSANTAECSICLETCSRPTKTPCDHNFCWRCINQVLRSDQTQSDGASAGPCPICRKEPKCFLRIYT